ncbi:hypothetical protein BDZ89DRAFT_578131 [Hymenopellis radicata]|nr:hypothetical protein BDZ89DRAFT_578131 [Hymenopellis radicata]
MDVLPQALVLPTDLRSCTAADVETMMKTVGLKAGLQHKIDVSCKTDLNHSLLPTNRHLEQYMYGTTSTFASHVEECAHVKDRLGARVRIECKKTTSQITDHRAPRSSRQGEDTTDWVPTILACIEGRWIIDGGEMRGGPTPFKCSSPRGLEQGDAG